MMYYVPIGPTSILHMIAFSPHLAIIISVKLYMRKINGIGGNIVMRDMYLHYCIFTTGKYIFILTLTSIIMIMIVLITFKVVKCHQSCDKQVGK